MTSRERFRAVMNFEPFDRLPLMEWATWWDKTLARWRSEGLPADLRTGEEIQAYFGLDVHLQDWRDPLGPACPRPPAHGAAMIADAAGYEAIRPHLFTRPVDKPRWKRWAALQARGEAVTWFTTHGFFWHARTLLGIEPHMYALYDQPALVHRINSDLTDAMLRDIDEICSVCVPDFMTFAEDMSYNHGPMLSRELFDEFMLPYYRRVIPALRRRGILAIVDSDGDVTTAWPWFERAGLDGILPLERQAGVDVSALRARHPRARFIGCFDKMVMTRGEQAVRAEFERLLPIARQGGLIISVDHQTPPGVSLQEYRQFLRLFREYAALSGSPCRAMQESPCP